MNAYQLNLSLSYLFTGIVLLGLTFFVYRRNPKSPVNSSFAIYSFSIAWWSLFSIFMINASTEQLATYYDRACLMGAIFIPTALIHFTCALLKIESSKKHIIRLCYGVSFLFLILNFTPYFVKQTGPIYHLNYFTVPGIGYYFFLIYFFSMAITGTTLLYRGYKNADNLHIKRQFLYLFLGTTLGYVGGSFNYNLVLHIPPYWTAPWGNYLIGLYGIIITYAIVKHHLMDIRIVIKKSLVHTILIAIITIVYFLFAFVVEKVFQNIIGYTSLFASIAAATTIAIIFIPLNNLIQSVVDRSIFHHSFPQIAEQNELLRLEVAQSEKHKAVAMLASSIAHEVKNPLTALKTFHEYFPEKKNDPEFMAKFNYIANKELGRIENLVQQLLDFAKPSPSHFQKADIIQVIEETLQLIGSKLAINNIQLNKNLTPNTYDLNIDAGKIKQALLNIFLNAIDAMPSGGTLTIESSVLGLEDLRGRGDKTSNPKILKSANHSFQISITDTGPGIDKKDLKYIFDPFYTKKENGTGLGLAITNGIIMEHKGSLRGNNLNEKGMNFTITLL